MREKLSDIVFPDFGTPDIDAMSPDKREFLSLAMQMEKERWLPLSVSILDVKASTEKTNQETTFVNHRVLVRGEHDFITRANEPAANGDPVRSAVFLHSFEKFNDADRKHTNAGHVRSIVYTDTGKAFMRSTSPTQKYLYEVDLGTEAPEALTKYVANFLSDVTDGGESKLSAKEIAEAATDAIAVYYATREGFIGKKIDESSRIAAPGEVDIHVIDLTAAKKAEYYATAKAIAGGAGFKVTETNLSDLIKVTHNLNRSFKPGENALSLNTPQPANVSA